MWHFSILWFCVVNVCHFLTLTLVKFACLCDVSFAQSGPLTDGRPNSVHIISWQNGVQKYPSVRKKTSLQSKWTDTKTNLSCSFNPYSRFLECLAKPHTHTHTHTHTNVGTISTNVISHFKMWQVSADVQYVAVRTRQTVKSFVEQTTIRREFKPSRVIRESSHGSCGLWLACSSVFVFCVTLYAMLNILWAFCLGLY